MTQTVGSAQRRRSWTADAACDVDGVRDLNWIMEPSSGRQESPRTVATLLEICAVCPVRRQCLEDAVGNTLYIEVGIWGGSTRAERMMAITDVGREDAPALLEETLDDRRRVWHVLALLPWCFDCGQVCFRFGAPPDHRHRRGLRSVGGRRRASQPMPGQLDIWPILEPEAMTA